MATFTSNTYDGRYLQLSIRSLSMWLETHPH